MTRFNFSAYIIFGATNSASNFLSFFLLASLCSEDIFSKFVTLQPIMVLAASLIGLNAVGLVSVVRKRFTYYRFEEFITSYLALAKSCSIALFCTFYFVFGQDFLIVSLVCLFGLLQCINALGYSVLVQDARPIRHGLSELSIRIPIFVIWISILVLDITSLELIVAALCVGEFVGGFVRYGIKKYLLLFKTRSEHFNFRFVRMIARYGLVHLPLLGLGWIVAYFDRFMFEFLTDPSAIALFGFCFSVCGGIIVSNTAIANLCAPEIYKNRRNFNKIKIVLKKISLISVCVNSIIGVLSYLLCKLFIFDLEFVKYDFSEAQPIIVFLLIGFSFNGLYRCMVSVLDANVWIYEKTILFLVAAALGLMISYVGFLYFGISGIVIGSACSSLFLVIFVFMVIKTKFLNVDIL